MNVYLETTSLVTAEKETRINNNRNQYYRRKHRRKEEKNRKTRHERRRRRNAADNWSLPTLCTPAVPLYDSHSPKPAGQPDVITTARTTQNPQDSRTLSLQLGQPKFRWATGHYHYSSDNPNPAGQPDIITTARTNQACLTTG